MTNETTAVILCRASTNKQRNSLQVQESLCRDFCIKGGLEVVGHFEEIESGGSLSRSQFEAAVNLAIETDSVLVATKVDRISRRISMIGGLIDKGIRIRVVQLGNQNVNKLVLGIFAILAEAERDLIKARTKESLRHLKSKGVKLGNPNAKAALVIARAADKEQADLFNAQLLEEIHVLRLAGVSSQNEIARCLNRKGITTRTGRTWSQGNVSRLLKSAR
jgi:DNA invertase Pin-like site-specific DNA recombinase